MNRRQLILSAFAPKERTVVSIEGDRFRINGKLTYPGTKLEGLLMNSRMVQGIYDDTNPATVQRWAYKDTGKWDADRNNNEFLAAMPEWRKHNLLAITVNLQGGSPEGYSKAQPWINSAVAPDGSLKPEYMARLKKIIDRADSLGMVVILGIFYFGQDQQARDEAAVKAAVNNTIQWIRRNKYSNILLEINNECNIKTYDHDILKPDRVHELIDMARKQKILTGTSYGGNTIPLPNVVKSSDFILIHGNGVKDSKRIREMVRLTRAVEGYTPKPILFNEDDHFDFDKPDNNMLTAVSERASWGYFDPEGYQSPPINWGLDTPRKKAFFAKLLEMSRQVRVLVLQARQFALQPFHRLALARFRIEVFHLLRVPLQVIQLPLRPTLVEANQLVIFRANPIVRGHMMGRVVMHPIPVVH